MPYENNSGLGVYNHFGPRDTGGPQGVIKTEGAYNEFTVSFDGEAYPANLAPIPPGSVVVDVVTAFAEGAVTSVMVGEVEVGGADGTAATYVEIPLGGFVDVDGPTAGKVIIKYAHVATKTTEADEASRDLPYPAED